MDSQQTTPQRDPEHSSSFPDSTLLLAEGKPVSCKSHHASVYSCVSVVTVFLPVCSAMTMSPVPTVWPHCRHGYIRMGLICTKESCRGWRDDSVVKDSCCSCKEPDFDSQQHLAGILKPPLCKFRYRRANALFWPVRTHICTWAHVCTHTHEWNIEVTNTCPFYWKVLPCLKSSHGVVLPSIHHDPKKHPRNECSKTQQNTKYPHWKWDAGGTTGHPCLSVTDKPARSWSCGFFCMCLLTAIKALTPSCLAPTLSSLSSGEPRLLLSSSLSKLNNHEEKNITCGEFAPFSFASHYPNSALILYHYYPPTNDRVEGRLSLTTYNTTHTTQAAIPSQCLALCMCP